MKLDLRDIPVIYINLERDVLKRERLEALLSELGFKEVTRLDATGLSGELNSKSIAISTSHKRALEIVQSYGTPAIILEDDCTRMDFKPIIEVPFDAEAFYLGTSIAGLAVTDKAANTHLVGRNSITEVEPDLFRIRGMNSTHAILYLSKEYVDASIRVCEQGIRTGIPHDMHLNHIHELFNVYCFKTPFFGNQSGLHTTGVSADSEPKPSKHSPIALKERAVIK
jgi:hypothetical protein